MGRPFSIQLGTMAAAGRSRGSTATKTVSMKILYLLLAVQHAAAKTGWGLLDHSLARAAPTRSTHNSVGSVPNPLSSAWLSVRGGAEEAAGEDVEEPAPTELYLPGLLETHIVRRTNVSDELESWSVRRSSRLGALSLT